ncbi:MAG: hypothetical protein U5K00_12275 [Melioribacteraceae bacterium]|nr:hypothetical protein [Melioribacteraceae bacterium]
MEYTLDDGTTWLEIEPSVPALDNSYTWSVPDTVSSLSKIKVTDVSDNLIADSSNNVFTITSGLTQISIPDTNVAAGESTLSQ